jgi:hypothetical protein
MVFKTFSSADRGAKQVSGADGSGVDVADGFQDERSGAANGTADQVARAVAVVDLGQAVFYVDGLAIGAGACELGEVADVVQPRGGLEEFGVGAEGRIWIVQLRRRCGRIFCWLACPVIDPVVDGQNGEHDGQVGFDRGRP